MERGVYTKARVNQSLHAKSVKDSTWPKDRQLGTISQRVAQPHATKCTRPTEGSGCWKLRRLARNCASLQKKVAVHSPQLVSPLEKSSWAQQEAPPTDKSGKTSCPHRPALHKMGAVTAMPCQKASRPQHRESRRPPPLRTQQDSEAARRTACTT